MEMKLIESSESEVIEVPAVAGVDEGQKCDTGNPTGVQDLFKQLVLQSNFAAHDAESKLQVEEKGNSVAELQGFCAGIREFKSVSKKAGFDVPPSLFDTANRMTPWIQKIEDADGNDDGDTICDLSLDELRLFSSLLEELTASDMFLAAKDSMLNKISEKKDFLYVIAKTSRELYWTHGWHRGFTWVENQIKELSYWKTIKEQQAEREAREKASELPFEDD